jgi:hypothetical protein
MPMSPGPGRRLVRRTQTARAGAPSRLYHEFALTYAHMLPTYGERQREPWGQGYFSSADVSCWSSGGVGCEVW